MFDSASGLLKPQASEAPAEAEGGFQRAHPHFAVVVEGQQVGESHLHRCIDEETAGQLVARHQHSLDWYATQLNVSPKRLSICVKQTSGRTATEWIDRHRLHEATRLLRQGHCSVKEVAAALGFPNQSAFGTWFKRQTGTSPSHTKGIQ